MHNDSVPRLERIVETALYVDDLATSRRFYVDILGCVPLLDSARLLALSVSDASVLLLFQRGATLAPLPNSAISQRPSCSRTATPRWSGSPAISTTPSA